MSSAVQRTVRVPQNQTCADLRLRPAGAHPAQGGRRRPLGATNPVKATACLNGQKPSLIACCVFFENDIGGFHD